MAQAIVTYVGSTPGQSKVQNIQFDRRCQTGAVLSLWLGNNLVYDINYESIESIRYEGFAPDQEDPARSLVAADRGFLEPH